MTKKLIWRLKEQPSTKSLQELISSGILTKDEAREILFSHEDERSDDSLKSEIKFLRELVEKLSKRDKVVEVIREIEKPYRVYPWYVPYETWIVDCATTDSGYTYTGGQANTTITAGTTTGMVNFSNISTF